MRLNEKLSLEQGCPVSKASLKISSSRFSSLLQDFGKEIGGWEEGWHVMNQSGYMWERRGAAVVSV